MSTCTLLWRQIYLSIYLSTVHYTVPCIVPCTVRCAVPCTVFCTVFCTVHCTVPCTVLYPVLYTYSTLGPAPVLPTTVLTNQQQLEAHLQLALQGGAPALGFISSLPNFNQGPTAPQTYRNKKNMQSLAHHLFWFSRHFVQLSSFFNFPAISVNRSAILAQPHDPVLRLSQVFFSN